MAGPWYVDDGGATPDGTTWALAYVTVQDMDAAKTLASGEIVYVGHNTADTESYAANYTITGPASGIPVYFISATQGSSPPTYAASTTAQIDTSAGAYDITWDGSFALYGISMKAGDEIRLLNDSNEFFLADSCRFALGANAGLIHTGGNSHVILHDAVIDLTADGTTNRSGGVLTSAGSGNSIDICGLSFVWPQWRTGSIVGTGVANRITISSADFSGFTNGTLCELATAPTAAATTIISNCITAATWAPMTGATAPGGQLWVTNTGPADAATYLYYANQAGDVLSTTAIYRTGGATVETEATAWLVTTLSTCSEGSPHQLPWMYGTVASTGSKNFDVYITNDTADLTDAEVWLEVEYLATADEAQTTHTSNHRTITTTAAAQTDDVTSTWNGSGPSYTYKQKLRVTATIGEIGMYRARVVVGLASIASSRYFYVDPAVTVS